MNAGFDTEAKTESFRRIYMLSKKDHLAQAERALEAKKTANPRPLRKMPEPARLYDCEMGEK